MNNKKGYKIGICGTMSVGKTTLVKALLELDEFKNYIGCVERSKYLSDLGVPLNTDSSVKGQLIFIAERASELFNDNLLTDRTVYDVCAFTKEAKSIKSNEKEVLFDAAMLLAKQYDVIFYISPEGIEIEDNGIRTTDPEYRDKIDKSIKWFLNTYKPKRLVEIKGSTEERIAMILEELEK
jgi:nicotinamide riboside kinase